MTIREGLNVAYAHHITLVPDQFAIREAIDDVLAGRPPRKRNGNNGNADLGVNDPAKLAKLDQYTNDLVAKNGPLPVMQNTDPNLAVDDGGLLAQMDALSGLL